MDWLNSFETLIATASRRPVQAFAWIRKVSSPKTNFASLADSEGFDSLDFKLHLASYPKLSPDIKTKVDTMMTLSRKTETRIKGRQMVWLQLQKLNIADRDQMDIDYKVLHALYMKDQNLRGFMGIWEKHLTTMGYNAPDFVLEVLS